MASPQPASLALYQEVSQFVYREAQFQDEHLYDHWEALWTDDAIYWVPANVDGMDPEKEMSIIYDNRSRIALRIRQLKTGKRFAQEPRSKVRRVVSNLEVSVLSEGEYEVWCNAIVFEANLRGEQIWSSRNRYLLRRENDELKMARKSVYLTNNDRALYTLAFLI
ncbi:MAG: aromatic-ring-hydroxylating dioxygenase subunit beta [Parvibaculaceae bacterium]